MSRSNSKTGTEIRRKGQRAAGILVVLLAFVFAAGVSPAAVWADQGGFTTDSFNVTVRADENHVFHVSEEISVDFSAPRHGIYRYIPDGDRYYSVRDIRVQGYNYDVYGESGNQVVQIGDGEVYVSGKQTYRISYDIVGYLDDDETKDMLSIDLLPTGWSTAIESADITLILPKPVEEMRFYSGAYGETADADEWFAIDTKVDGEGEIIHAQSKRPLPEGIGLTVSADLPEGYWVDPESRDKALPAIYGALGVMGMLMLLLWLFIGRDDPIIRTVEFYPPEGIDPLEAAYIANDKVETRDLSALFMYFANKGYVKISSDDPKRFSMEKICEIDTAEPLYARQIFRALFSEGSRVGLNDLPDSFGEVAAGIKKDVPASMDKKKRNYSAASKTGRAIGLVFCFIIPVFAGLCCSYLSFMMGAVMAGTLCGLVILVFMTGLLARTDAFRSRKRPVGIVIGFIFILAAIAFEAFVISEYPIMSLVFAASTLAAVIATVFVRRRMNNEIYGRVLGFRDFIRTAEYDRLKMLSDENPEYYFNILPYAYIFGMTTKWAERFAGFKIPQPSWYEGSYPYDPMLGRNIFVHSGNGLNSAVSSYYRAVGVDMLSDAIDSGTGGGGGFGGGGFSGGGFGGGGGGSW